MIALWLLAAHLVGDFILQTRWQAVGKFGSTRDASALRAKHVLAYCLPFVPIAFAYAGGPGRALGFLLLLAVFHYATDARRFTSTLGDTIAWHFGSAGPPVEKRGVHAAMGADLGQFIKLAPNPWSPLPTLIDQTLHVVQIAVLAGVLL